MTWYHGTPDVRALRDTGAFTPRTEPRRYVRDPERMAQARAAAKEEGLSTVESAIRLSAVSACVEHVHIPVPVFLAARAATARTYADDRRALDYQNAEPALLGVEMDRGADITIDAHRATFRSLSWAHVEDGVRRAGRDPKEVSAILERGFERPVDGRLRVSDLGAALWLAGFRVVDVKNVIDTHTGVGTPDTVRMVFEPETLRIPMFGREDVPQP